MNPVVVIPVHSSLLSSAQLASLQQAREVLGAYPIVLVCPDSLDVAVFRRIDDGLSYERFPDDCFASFRAHQRMMISSAFYDRFRRYSHLLVYHLDAWVFRDELLDWCEQPYDYIGAPWRSGFDCLGLPEFRYAGNGGFSLRRVEAFARTLTMFDNRSLKSAKELVQEFSVRKGVSKLKHLLSLPLKLVGVGNSLKQFHHHYPYTEDKFWALACQVANPEFRVAPVTIATRFAFEASPEYLWKINSETLPFGCHAWRYEQNFWCGKIGIPWDTDFRPRNDDGDIVK
jgi:hypothetical protein